MVFHLISLRLKQIKTCELVFDNAEFIHQNDAICVKQKGIFALQSIP